jgi:uncharacterized protein YlzI (FlbEa/FlbD family)
MKILKLNQRAVLTRPVDSIIGYEEKTVYEPVFVVAEHIESFAFYGATHIKMRSGDKIVVQETAEEICRQMSGQPSEGEIEFWAKLGESA